MESLEGFRWLKSFKGFDMVYMGLYLLVNEVDITDQHLKGISVRSLTEFILDQGYVVVGFPECRNPFRRSSETVGMSKVVRALRRCLFKASAEKSWLFTV